VELSATKRNRRHISRVSVVSAFDLLDLRSKDVLHGSIRMGRKETARRLSNTGGEWSEQINSLKNGVVIRTSNLGVCVQESHNKKEARVEHLCHAKCSSPRPRTQFTSNGRPAQTISLLQSRALENNANVQFLLIFVTA
jgi:hypothetical protein